MWKSSSFLVDFTLFTSFCLLTGLKTGLHVIFKGLVQKGQLSYALLKKIATEFPF